MKTISIKELAKYENQYILLSKDNTKIIAAAKTIEELEEKSKKLKIISGTLEYIPPLDKALSLICD